MKRFFLIPIALSAAFLLLSLSPTFAEDAKDSYLVIKPGVYSPQHDDLKDFDLGPNIEFGGGVYINKYLGSELTLGYFRSKGDVKSSSGVILGNMTMNTFDINYYLKGIFFAGPVELYGGGGIGVYFTYAELETGTDTDSDLNTALGVQALVGGNYNINKDLFVGLEGRYLWANSDFEFSGVPSNSIHLDGFSVNVTVGTRF